MWYIVVKGSRSLSHLLMSACILLCRCEDTYNTTDCERRALEGECNTNPGFMIARCSRTCLGCGQKDPGMRTTCCCCRAMSSEVKMNSIVRYVNAHSNLQCYCRRRILAGFMLTRSTAGYLEQEFSLLYA